LWLSAIRNIFLGKFRVNRSIITMVKEWRNAAMRIHNIFSDPKVGLREAGSSVEGPGRSSDAALRQTADASLHTPAPELVHFLSLARQSPQIRSDAVQRAAERVAAGDYLTPAAAHQTAQAIVDSPDN
jgi:hypothetical protein